MATGISTSLGSVLIHGYTAAGVFYEPYLTETYDVSTNTSTLSIAHRIRIMEEWGGRYDIPDNTPIYVTIDGTTTTHTFSSMPSVYPNNKAVTVQTTTHTVDHNSDGTKTITISCRWNNSSAQYQGATSSKTVTLTTIPRASSMSFNASQTMGTAYTFTISRASSSFSHWITWSFGGSSGTAVYKTSSTTPSFTPSISTFAPLLTNATSATITYNLDTYSGDTFIGRKSYTATLSVPSSVVPSVSLAVSAVNPFNSLYLQGKSSVKLTATGSVSSDHGATIRSYSFQVLNSASTAVSSGSSSTSSTSATHTSGVLSGSGTHTCKVTITDSRGRTATATKTITVTAYSKPVWGNVSAYRCDSSGNSADEGTHIALTANCSYSAVSGNSLTMSYQYKEATASSWSSSHSYTNGTKTVIGSSFDITKGYNVKVTATDTVGKKRKKKREGRKREGGREEEKKEKKRGRGSAATSGAADAGDMPKGYAYGPGGAFSKLITEADIGGGAFSTPYLTASQTGASATAWTSQGMWYWLRYVTQTYGAKIQSGGAQREVLSTFQMSSTCFVIGFAYDWTDLVGSFPRHSTFMAFGYGGSYIYTFGTQNGEFFSRRSAAMTNWST